MFHCVADHQSANVIHKDLVTKSRPELPCLDIAKLSD